MMIRMEVRREGLAAWMLIAMVMRVGVWMLW